MRLALVMEEGKKVPGWGGRDGGKVETKLNSGGWFSQLTLAQKEVCRELEQKVTKCIV